jgi:hypothetical protein
MNILNIFFFNFQKKNSNLNEIWNLNKLEFGFLNMNKFEIRKNLKFEQKIKISTNYENWTNVKSEQIWNLNKFEI